MPISGNGTWILNSNYWEREGSGEFQIAGDNQLTYRTFLTNWIDAQQFALDCLGYAYVQQQGSEYKILRVLPDAHPYFGQGGNNPCLFATEVSGKGLGHTWTSSKTATMTVPGTTFIKYDRAELNVTYRAVDYQVLKDNQVTSELQRYVTRTSTYSGEYLTFDGRMKYNTPDGAVKRELHNLAGKIVCNVEKTLTWHMVPDPDSSNVLNPPNYANVLKCLGKLNNAVFDGDPVGTVLFLGLDPHRTKPNFTNGQVYWDIAMKFGVKNNGSPIAGDTTDGAAGWQYIYNPYVFLWDLISSDGTTSGNRLYQYADLSTLFKLPV